MTTLVAQHTRHLAAVCATTINDQQNIFVDVIHQSFFVDLIHQSPMHWSPELRWTDEKLRYDDDGRSNSAAPVRL